MKEVSAGSTNQSIIVLDVTVMVTRTLKSFASEVLKNEQDYSTVTDFAKLRGLSTSVPRAHAVW
jgi:hypothetical protein